MSTETEGIKASEEALIATESIRQFEKLVCVKRGGTRLPEENFWEHSGNIATFLALVWVLFGSNCNTNEGI